MAEFPFDGHSQHLVRVLPRRLRRLGGPGSPHDELVPLEPSFVSVTYGAGGSNRERTHELVERRSGHAPTPVPHLTCLGHTREEIDQILERYARPGFGSIPQARATPCRRFRRERRLRGPRSRSTHSGFTTDTAWRWRWSRRFSRGIRTLRTPFSRWSTSSRRSRPARIGSARSCSSTTTPSTTGGSGTASPTRCPSSRV